MEKILNLFRVYGHTDYIGERVTQEQHALQCAHLARMNGHDIYFIIACLLHDIGHLVGLEQGLKTMDNLGTYEHDIIGEKWLRELGMCNTVCELVGSHVQTKRYIITTHPNYFNKLSEASKKTFLFQGGKMSKKEVSIFRHNDLFQGKIALRCYDDKAKVVGWEVPCLESYISDMKLCFNL